MKNTHKSTINFMYFIANFPLNFINKVWADSPEMRDHLTTKYNNIVKNPDYNIEKFVMWFYDLDQKNKVKLLQWVDKNYLASNTLKQQPHYYLFGEQACKLYDSEDFEVFCKEMVKTYDFGLYAVEPGEDPAGLLGYADGWMDYCEISEREYNTLLKL